VDLDRTEALAIGPGSIPFDDDRTIEHPVILNEAVE
jgi:hypothetical protein